MTSLFYIIKEGNTGKVYNILRDYLGSITHVVDANGNLVQELSYDAWGRLRDPATREVYSLDKEPSLFLGRGYTGHEHLQPYGLINMNARLYDPTTGRFLSADPYVQMPECSQSFNRYSYCMNNPLRYTDKTGKFLGFITGFFRGLFQGKNPFKTAWHTGVNEIKIYAGLFGLDSHKSILGRGWEFISRFTWQLPQTLAGFEYAHISNLAWQVDHVSYWGGATASSGNFWGGKGAVTLGSFITGSSSLKADPNNSLFQHEYGHYLQSQEMGWGFLPRVGIPSLMSAWKHDGMHKYQPFEQDANRRAFLYFNKHVDGFYKAENEMFADGGWDFINNPLDIYHIPGYKSYVDYKNPNHLGLLNSLTLHAHWYDYAGWPGGLGVVAGIGIGNGIYYNHNRIK